MIIKLDHRNLQVEALPIGEDKVDGLFLNYERKIHVSPGLCPPEQASTLLHELLHAIWATRGLPPRLNEEEVCTALAPALATVIRDNPLLMRGIILALTEDMPLFEKGE